MSKITFAIAALAAVASARGSLNSSDPLQAALRGDPKFTAFMSRNNKECKDTATFQLRSSLYHHTDDMIEENNARAAASGDPTHVILGHNFTSDLTPEEKQTLFGLNMGVQHDRFNTMQSGGMTSHGGPRSSGRGRGLANAAAVNVDHAADNHMHAVKNQGFCGSCSYFATTTCLEGTIAKKTGNPPERLSEQQSVDCTLRNANVPWDQDYGCYGCDGCWMSNSWNMMRDQGVMAYNDYTYTGEEGNCKHDTSKIWGYVSNYNTIPSNSTVSQIKDRLKLQPFTIALDASSGVFQNYKSGVVKRSDNCGTTLNHAVVVVGYTDSADDMDGGDDDDTDISDDESDISDDEGDNDSQTCTVEKWWYSCEGTAGRRLSRNLRQADNDGNDKYWKIQNSWGSNWGDNGYIRLEIEDGGQGTCRMYAVMQYVDGYKN